MGVRVLRCLKIRILCSSIYIPLLYNVNLNSAIDLFNIQQAMLRGRGIHILMCCADYESTKGALSNFFVGSTPS